MRYLHKVNQHEKFVASGTYIHYRNGEATKTREHWRIHEQPDGAHFIRVDDDWRDDDGSSVLIEAWRSPFVDGGRIERVDLTAFGSKNAEIKQVKATFTANDEFLDIGRTIDSNDREYFEVRLPDGYILSPESLIFAGFEVAELALRQGESVPVMSYLPTFLNASASFRPVIHKQSATFLRDETLTIDGKALETRCFQQISVANGEISRLWIDKHDILVKYMSEDGQYSALLTQYANRA